jgi:hypothetical protein
MSGRRRIPRSIRLLVALALVLSGASLAIAASVTDHGAVLAAIAAAVCALGAVRVMYLEVAETRLAHARERARQSRDFQRTLASSQAEQAIFVASMERRMGFKDRAIGELSGTLRLAEARADEAETRARRETRRANEVQVRLADLLDEVLTQQTNELSAIDDAHDPDLPTIVDLLAWEERVNESLVHDLRKEA